MFSLVYAVYCQNQPPKQRCSVKKGVLKNFVILQENSCVGVSFKQTYRPDIYFEEYLPKTAFALHTHHSLLLIRFTLYSGPSSSSSLSLLKSSRLEVFYKKDVFRKFAKFTGKHLCQSFFLMKLQGLGILHNNDVLTWNYKNNNK